MNTYNEQEKILRVNLRLQMSLAIRVDQTELEWEVTASSPKEQTIELLTNYLKRQKYFTSTGKIFSLKTRYSLGEKEESKQEIKILKNPLQTRILEDPLAKKSVRQEYLNLNLLLEAYQTKEASFDTILNNLCVDLERTFVDRIYSNLELGNVNLPKRTIVYTNGGFFGTPVYIAPGEELTKKITQAGLDTTLPRNNSESPFGSCSEKTIQKSGGPKTGSEEKGNEAQQRPKPNAKKGEATSSEVEAARDEAQKTQKFLMIVFAIILMFVAYKWAIKPNI